MWTQNKIINRAWVSTVHGRINFLRGPGQKFVTGPLMIPAAHDSFIIPRDTQKSWND